VTKRELYELLRPFGAIHSILLYAGHDYVDEYDKFGIMAWCAQIRFWFDDDAEAALAWFGNGEREIGGWPS